MANGGILLEKRTAAGLDSAPAGKVRVFIDENGHLAAKDESGAVVSAQSLITTIEAQVVSKQDAATAATDTELAAAKATLETAITSARALAEGALPQTGGTLTGPLTLSGDPTQNLHAATRQYVQAQIAALINGAPGALDTLKEIADQMSADESAFTALTATVANRLAAASNLADVASVATARENLGAASTGDVAARQPLDSDLTAIAGLNPADGAILVRASGAWAQLAKGTTGQHLVVRTDGTLAWADAPTVNVKAWGAVGDGATDDYAAIKAAYDTLPEGGGVLDFSGLGICGTGTELKVTKPSVRFTGRGWDQESTVAGSCIKALSAMTSVVNVEQAASTFKLDTMWIEGAGKATNCLTIDSLNCDVRNAYFRRPATNGVGVNVTSHGTSLWMTNVRVNCINQAGSTSIRLNATDSTLYGVKPVNCAVGIEYQNGASGGLLVGSHITPGSTIGLNCVWVSAACSNLGITGNRFDNHALGAAIQVDPSADFFGLNICGNVFFQNVIETDKFSAIQVDTSTAMVNGMNVVGNTVRSTTSHRYLSLLGAQKRNGETATNTGRLSSYGSTASLNTIYGKETFAGGTPLVHGGNTFSADGVTWEVPPDSSNPTLGGDLTGTATAAVIVGGAPTRAQRAKYSQVAGQTPRESIPFFAAANNIAPTSGQLLLVILPVVPGDVITNVGFVVGSTAATFGSTAGTYHQYTCLYDVKGEALLRKSTDKTNTALAASSAHPYALESTYTVPAGVDALLAGVLINVGAGGSPVTPTLRGATLNVAQVDGATSLFTTSRVFCATNGAALTEPPAGPLALAASGNVPYVGAN